MPLINPEAVVTTYFGITFVATKMAVNKMVKTDPPPKYDRKIGK